MKRKDFLDILIYAAASLKSRIEDNEILLDALGIDPEEKDAAEQKAGGVHYLHNTMQKEKETLAIIENELDKLARVPEQWRTVGAENVGRVHVCPYCDGKSPEKFHYCPNCGADMREDEE